MASDVSNTQKAKPIYEFVRNSVRNSLENAPKVEGKGKRPPLQLESDFRQKLVEFKNSNPEAYNAFIQDANAHANRELEPLTPNNPELNDVQEQIKVLEAQLSKLKDKRKELTDNDPTTLLLMAATEIAYAVREAVSKENKMSSAANYSWSVLCKGLGLEAWGPIEGDSGQDGSGSSQDDGADNAE